jgi:ADP-heptose:LPS heptosyltransferase
MRLDRVRTMPLEKFAPLARHARLFLVQTDVRAQDEAWLRENEGCVHSLAQSLGGFDDAAAAVECLDLVITVDTALAHLAGALAKPTWILLPWESEWRWLLEREDSPWYPTARLFRKGRTDTWDDVVLRVEAELAARRG